MPTIVDIETRRISGTGILRVPALSANLRQYYLFADIIRQPVSRYLSTVSEPPTTFYGKICLQREGYVVDTFDLIYDAQKWIFVPDISAQTLLAVKCAYLGILETFADIGEALGLTLESVTNTIDDYKFLPLDFDTICLQCYATSAVQLTLKGLTYDSCRDDYLAPAPLPEPPTKPDAIAPNTPTNISEPYPDDEITNRSPLDDNYIPPPVAGTWAITNTEPGNTTQTFDQRGFSTDIFKIITPGTNCNQSFSSNLVKNDDNEVIFAPFNCNNTGFISSIVSQVFTPD